MAADLCGVKRRVADLVWQKWGGGRRGLYRVAGKRASVNGTYCFHSAAKQSVHSRRTVPGSSYSHHCNSKQLKVRFLLLAVHTVVPAVALLATSTL